ncbi:E3 ubiquitin-protein ligase makorin [Selaginella moellendorffii]|uniref:E3 ubiquitin-protein ligase makorin n=1 Tax=Selaginella moellendorffii TaxID=88036 RepID=UPI000D1C74F5|nr:E3 ubiquitin-protein ligase makorin [Selaginella moellendorffii]|eukprot:XP_024518066.1 E3 ubiquitin-protein ligase makorin [Selaginella moellendorffii]
MPQHRILCKYYLHGACLKGDSCQFSHSFDDPSSNICTFYQRGVCSYGSRCRYEHVRLPRPKLPFVPPFNPAPSPSSTEDHPSPKTVFSQAPSSSATTSTTATTTSPPAPSPLLNAWQERPLVPPPAPSPSLATFDTFEPDPWEEFQAPDTASLDLADRPICSFAAAGYCPYGDSCSNLHGDLCESCGKHCLHPFREAEREEHREQCVRSQKRLELLRMSQDIECSVCLERVLSKPSMSDRKFGILSGCDHPFCIACIRDWRGGTRPGMDLETIVRACPICRVSSHYVIPSVVWYSNTEEKEEIVNGYKNKLSSIDCKYFEYGNSTCPFGTSCFYRHAYGDGTKEEVKLRHLGTAEGTTVIAKNIRLSDFLTNLKK